MYHIGYVNANSLPDGKFAQAVCLLEKSFDFLFIAEHWYQHHNARLAHPLIFCSTTLPLSTNKTLPRGRKHGGIYLLVRPHLRSLIQSTTSSQYSITVSLPGFRFTAVYYPPYSLSEQNLKHNLNLIGPVDLLLGDINTKFPFNSAARTNISSSSTTTRSILFQTWAVNCGMVHISDNTQNTISHQIPDHVFASTQIQSDITLHLVSTRLLAFQTDHRYLLHVQYHHNAPPTTPHCTPIAPIESVPGPVRFHIQRLRKPKVVQKFQKNWALMDSLFTRFKGSEAFDVDMLDGLLCSAVQGVAETVLGIYHPEDARKKEDQSAQRLATQLDMPSSIQLVKRAQRTSAIGLKMVSATSTSTPMAESIDHYSTIFDTSDHNPNFQAIRTDHTPNSPSHSRNTYVSSILPNIPSCPTFDEVTVLASGLLDTVTTDKIKFQLGRMSSTSSCGSDGITVIMLRHLLETTFPQHLCQLYHACLRSGQTPARWNEALVYPLCKDRKKPYTATNSRPISILCLFRKLFESLILPVISASGHITYSGIQAGLRSGYSTLTNVLTLHHLIEADAARHIVFLDFASAFDRVGWTYLQQELQEQGMNPLVLQLVYQLMYRDMSYSLIVNGCQSPKQPRTCGLLQGSPLSPILFNRFINSLLQSLNWNSQPTFPSGLFFADDGVLIAPTITKAQGLVNQASSWADKHGMSFNIPKCGYMVTNQPIRSESYLPHTLTLANQHIPFVTFYKYLGIMFQSKGIDFLEQGNLLS